MSTDGKSGRKPRDHGEETGRPDAPQLEGGTPLPEELTGRSSGTGEDLTALCVRPSC